MTKLPTDLGFELDQVYCYKDASLDPWTFSYIPGAPSPEMSSNGKPTISLLTSQQGAMLQLQTRWDTAPSLLKSLKVEVANRHPNLNADLISVEMAAVSAPQVTLSIGDGQNEPKAIETFNSSGFSPYSTVINVRLTATEAAQALSAFEGLENRLLVTYSGTLRVSSSVVTTLEGDVSADIQALTQTQVSDDKRESDFSWIGNLFGTKNRESYGVDSQPENPIFLEDCMAQIEKALRENRLSAQQLETGPISDEAKEKGIEAAKQMAAHHLLSLVNSASVNAIPDESIIQIKDEQTIMQKYTIERQTDVASWFPAGDGMSYMQISPAPIEEPDRTP